MHHRFNVLVSQLGCFFDPLFDGLAVVPDVFEINA